MAAKGKSNPISYRPASKSLASGWGSAAFPVERIVSGGQTGVDRAALDFAIEHGIPHGGWCPHARWAEDGAIEAHYNLNETPDRHCAQRTEWNVRDSDGTVIFSLCAELSTGSALTQKLARLYGKPCLHLSKRSAGHNAATILREFIARERIRVLNVAGPRRSTEPDAADFASEVLESCCRAEPVRT